MNEKKAQSAIEFMVLVGAALFFFLVFFLLIQENSADKIKERQNDLIKKTAFAIQDEINLAHEASEGYLREFMIPDKMNNADYDILIIEEMIYIKTENNESAIALPIQKVSGNAVKGENIIRKENGEVKIN